MNIKRYLPARLSLNDLRAWGLGFRDGWNQPHELGSSYNVEHLDDPIDGRGSVFESLDAGINFGQLVRSPRHHQRFDN